MKIARIVSGSLFKHLLDLRGHFGTSVFFCIFFLYQRGYPIARIASGSFSNFFFVQWDFWEHASLWKVTRNGALYL